VTSSNTTIDSSILGFIAGFVDTCVFVGLFGLFTAHVTGNFVLIGAELVHHSGDVLPKLLALPVFMLAVAAAAKAVDALRQRRRNAVVAILVFEALFLFMSAAAAFSLKAAARSGDASALAIGMLACAAMGLQNAMMRLELTALPSTTVMTINVTQAVIDAVTIASSTDIQKRNDARARSFREWPAIVAFTLGAASGAAGYAFAGLGALAVPALLCVLLAVRYASPRHPASY